MVTEPQEQASPEQHLASFEPLSMIGDRVQLRPLDPSDYPSLYWIENDPALPASMRRFPESTPPESFGTSLWANANTQFAILSTADSTLIGVASLQSVNARSGHGRLHLLVRPDLLAEKWPWEAMGIFLDHIFVTHPLRKVYFDVVESMFGLFAGGAGRVFVVEANLVEHQWGEGRWQDMLMLAFHREHWMTLANRVRSDLGEVFFEEPLEDLGDAASQRS